MATSQSPTPPVALEHRSLTPGRAWPVLLALAILLTLSLTGCRFTLSGSLEVDQPRSETIHASQSP